MNAALPSNDVEKCGCFFHGFAVEQLCSQKFTLDCYPVHHKFVRYYTISLRGTKKSPAFSLRAQGRAHTVFALTRRGVLAAAVASVGTGLCLLAALRDSSKGLRITVLCPGAAPGRFMCPVPGGQQAEAHGNPLISSSMRAPPTSPRRSRRRLAHIARRSFEPDPRLLRRIYALRDVHHGQCADFPGGHRYAL